MVARAAMRGAFADHLVHPDGRRALAMTREGAVVVFELDSGEALAHLPILLPADQLAHACGATLRLHPDGVRLFATVHATDGDTETLGWNLETDGLFDTYPPERTPIAFVGEDRAVSVTGAALVLWDLATMAEIHTTHRDAGWDVRGTLGEHALLADGELWNLRTGDRAWTASARGAAAVRDVAILASPGRLELRGAIARDLQVPFADLLGAWTVCVDDELRFAAIAGAGPECFAIDLATGAIASVFAPGALAWSGGRAVVDGCVWEVASGACLLRAPGKVEVAGDRAVWNDGYGLRVHPLDGTDLLARPPAWIAIDPTGQVAIDAARVVHPGGWRLPDGPFAVGSERIAAGDGVFDLAGARLATLPSATSFAIAGTRVASAHGDEVRVAGARFHVANAALLALAATQVAVRSELAIELWRIADPVRLHAFPSEVVPTCAAFGGRWLVVGHEHGVVIVYDTETGTRHAMWEAGSGVTRVAIRGTRVAICRVTGNVSLWELADHAVQLVEPDAAVLDVAWTGDGTLACATTEGLRILTC